MTAYVARSKEEKTTKPPFSIQLKEAAFDFRQFTWTLSPVPSPNTLKY
jgi:hypothetical protein